ncbi:small acid-soluble spore protein P [Paenibacillus thermoaerophilus]|uniref:Small acid-soluble spore protein P n=1 Tax=Paenibacillus thermoaerophilus TaxID=1215385 RepID=A0ABW2V8M3_9BACL|nr:small acid-soluble spore protein P [Paenibacillus thermoaerophilus]TMV12461.1 small acid-soluble spore protein P [Paenibacillus thermoaerophilus]
MSKPDSVAVNPPGGQGAGEQSGHGVQEPNSGSKTVKNHSHSRANKGEGR